MKALVYTGTMATEIRDVPEPEPGPGQVLVDLAYCGLCGSDMHAWHGRDERRVPPLVLGHEAVGTATTGDMAGRRVAVNPLMTCGDCGPCHRGNEHLCAGRELIGMKVPGAFAERLAVDAVNLYPIGDGLGFEMAALAEPLACAIHAVRLGPLEPAGREVAILGGGAIGLLAAHFYRHLGFTAVRIAETNARRRAGLAKLGLGEVYDPLEGGPGGADIVFDAVGSGATRKAASSLARPGGTIVHIGLQDSLEGLDTRRVTLQEIAFVGSYCYRNSDFEEALALLDAGAVETEGWTEIRPLDEGGDAFLAVHEGRAPAKVILETG